MKTILVTNDDGIYGPGLKPLVKALKKVARVIVIVPDQERSGTSHSITLHKPLRIQELGSNTFIANGTPTDCVRFGVLSLVKSKVDVVVSGINTGPNLGQDVIYSGTVAGAREGTLLGIPSIALSAAESAKANFPLAARIAEKLVKHIFSGVFPSNVYLNVNVPYRVKGFRVTSLCKRIYDEEIECRIDPRGQKYYWLAGKTVSGAYQAGTDLAAVNKGLVSITPLKLDPTATELMGAFNQWITDLN